MTTINVEPVFHIKVTHAEAMCLPPEVMKPSYKFPGRGSDSVRLDEASVWTLETSSSEVLREVIHRPLTDFWP